MMIKKLNKKVILLFLFFAMLEILLVFTYATNSNPLQQTVFSKILRIDEEAYGDTEFNSDYLDFRPILDWNVETSFYHVIYIDFYVGGDSTNDDENIVYDIALVDLDVDCELLSPYLKWRLVKNREEIFEGSFDYQFDTITQGRLVLTNIQQDLKNYSQDKSTYDYYQFYIWLSDSCQSENMLDCVGQAEDQSNLLNKSLKGKIEVELYAKSKEMLVRNPSSTLHANTCNSGGSGSSD